jgi:hypothetical protein
MSIPQNIENTVQSIQDTSLTTTADEDDKEIKAILTTRISTNEYINESFVIDDAEINSTLNIEDILLNNTVSDQADKFKDDDPNILETNIDTFKNIELDSPSQANSQKVSESDTSLNKNQESNNVTSRVFLIRQVLSRIDWEKAAKIYKIFLAVLSTITITSSIFLVKQCMVLAASDMAMVKFTVQVLLCIPLIIFYKEKFLGKF